MRLNSSDSRLLHQMRVQAKKKGSVKVPSQVNPPVTGGFPRQIAINAESIPMSWNLPEDLQYIHKICTRVSVTSFCFEYIINSRFTNMD